MQGASRLGASACVPRLIKAILAAGGSTLKMAFHTDRSYRRLGATWLCAEASALRHAPIHRQGIGKRWPAARAAISWQGRIRPYSRYEWLSVTGSGAALTSNGHNEQCAFSPAGSGSQGIRLAIVGSSAVNPPGGAATLRVCCAHARLCRVGLSQRHDLLVADLLHVGFGQARHTPYRLAF
jgi:hypothetical protein